MGEEDARGERVQRWDRPLAEASSEGISPTQPNRWETSVDFLGAAVLASLGK